MRLWTELASAEIMIDILVNNAGSGFYGNVEDQDPDALERMLQVNIVALTLLTRLALPGMQARRWGQPERRLPGRLPTRRTAHGRLLREQGVRCILLERSRARAQRERRKRHGFVPGTHGFLFEERSGAGRTILYKHLPKMTAAAVARAGYEGMRRQSTVVIPGLLPKILAFAGELPPRRIAVEVNRLLLREA